MERIRQNILALPRYFAILVVLMLPVAVMYPPPLAAQQLRDVPDTVANEVWHLLAPFTPFAEARLQVKLGNPDGIYKEGEFFSIELRPLDQSAYIYVDFFQLDGTVTHIFPNPDLQNNYLKVGNALLLGNADGDLTYQVLPPFGREILVVTASEQPLFIDARREVEPGLVYLKALKAGLPQGVSPAGIAVILRIVQIAPVSEAAPATSTVQDAIK